MKENRNMKENLITVTLDYIQRQERYTTVSLREIARRAGCAHTNAYNYFPNLNSLIWACFDRILDEYVHFTQEQMKQCSAKPDNLFKEWILAQIDFALKHKGYYRLIWMDMIIENLPQVNLNKFYLMKAAFEELVLKSSMGRLSHEGAVNAANILHGYLHGEICKLICGRIMYQNIQVSRETIAGNVLHLFERLRQE